MAEIVTAARIKALCPRAAALVDEVAPFIEALRAEYRVTTPKRAAHFIAQMAHESDGFSRLEERLNYSAKRIGQVWDRLRPRAAELARNPEALANAAYGGRLGNGDEASGDGWRYRGRGLVQLTGRANYRDFGDKVGLEIDANPEQAALPEPASRLALAYWNATGCNERADVDDVEGITRRINGGTKGLAERQHLTTRALTIFI